MENITKKIFIISLITLPLYLVPVSCAAGCNSCKASLSFAKSEEENSQNTGSEVPVTYQVTVTGMWQTNSHPNGPTSGALPGGAHFTSMATMIHDDTISFWESGGMATTGIENVAELGSTSALQQEATNAGTQVSSFAINPAPSLSGMRMYSIEATSTHSLLSMISMIAPSPDWFIGLSSVELTDAEGKWYRCLNSNLVGYDAGTEDATAFTLGGTARNPHENIHRLSEDTALQDAGYSLAEPFASIQIELLNIEEIENTQISEEIAVGNCKDFFEVQEEPETEEPETEMPETEVPVTYQITVTGMWQTGSHPNGPTSGALPGGAHFTSMATMIHDDTISFWESGGMATTGIENVAELGSTSALQQEATNAGTQVSSFAINPAPSLSGMRMYSIEATSTHSLLSMISMIAPSPDWFIGLSSVELTDAEGKWYRCLNSNLVGYDAGTEDATAFTLGGTARNPHENIHRLSEDTALQDAGLSLTEPFAAIQIELLNIEDIESTQISEEITAGNCKNL